jgi:uracil-DNA glycosylase
MDIVTNWKPIIEELLVKYPAIRKHIENDTYYPQKCNVFRAFNYFNIEDTKVVILGQDPYHGENQAIGLAFGVKCSKIPPSLKNIIKELQKYNGKDLQDTTLENWAKQGVLLLNYSLTVHPKKPGSNMKLWKDFTNSILSKLDKKVIFVAWGAFAYELLKDKENLLYSSHPSPLSYSRKYKDISFKDSNIFENINKLLEGVIVF